MTKYGHYKKDISHLKVLDPYRICTLFGVHDPCLQHALKKILCAGQRGAKDAAKDVQEARDSLDRWDEMREEDQQAKEAAC